MDSRTAARSKPYFYKKSQIFKRSKIKITPFTPLFLFYVCQTDDQSICFRHLFTDHALRETATMR